MTYTQDGSASCTRNLQVPWKQKSLWASVQSRNVDLTAAATGGSANKHTKDHIRDQDFEVVKNEPF